MNFYEYDLSKADECLRLINDIADEYNRIYRRIETSFSDIPGLWSGESAAEFQKKCDTLLSDMNLTDLKLNELAHLTAEKEEKLRAKNNNALKNITGW